MPLPYIIIIVLATGFSGGFYVRDLMTYQERAAELEAAQQEAKSIERLNAELYDQLSAEREKIKIVEKEVIKKIYVPKIQKVDSECNLSIGTKRMLNSAILSEASGSTTQEDTKASEIREADAIRYLNSAIAQYNEVRAQCNALIEFHSRD